MAKKLLLIIVFIGFLSGCSNLMTAEAPDFVLTETHDFGTTALAYTMDGQRLISGGFLGDIRLWDAVMPRPLGKLNGHRRAVRAILPLASGAFVSAGDDGRLILWEKEQIKTRIAGRRPTALALFQGHVISGHDDKRLRVWTADALHAVREIRVEGTVIALSVHDNLLAVGLERAILLMDADFKLRRTIPTDRTPHDLQFSPDGRNLAAGSWFHLNLWDIASAERRSIATEHNGLVTSIAFRPDGRHLASLGRHTDSATRILDTRDFRTVKRYQAHALCGTVIRYSPDGTMLASGSDDGSVHLHRTGLQHARRNQPSNGAIPAAH